MNMSLPFTSIWHFIVLIAMLIFALYIIIRAIQYWLKCEKGQETLNPMKLLSFLAILLIGLSIGWLLMGAMRTDQRIATPQEDSTILPGGVDKDLVEDVEPPDEEELDRKRRALKKAKGAAERQKELDSQKTFEQDREAYRESMGLTDPEEQPAEK